MTDLGATFERRLTTSGDCSSPSWSPDGTKLVYVRSTEYRNAYIWVLDVPAGTAARFTPKPSEYSCPRWSPDGKWVACFSYDDNVPFETEYTPSRLNKVNVQTKAVAVLRGDIWGAFSLDWSPNSAQIVCSYGTEGDATIAVVDAGDGHTVKRALHSIKRNDTPEVAIYSLNWAEPNRIVFCEEVWVDACEQTIGQVTLDGIIQTIHEFPEVNADDDGALSLSAVAGLPLLVSRRSTLWFLQDGEFRRAMDHAEQGVLGK